jgi:NitT/TauT family transport system ATP-binding protein
VAEPSSSDLRIDAAVHAFCPHGSQPVRIGPFTLEVKPQQFVALVGPPGCGKTTLLRMAAGVLLVSSGTIAYGWSDSQDRQGLGVVFSKPGLLPWRTVLENVQLGAELRGIRTAVTSERARYLIASMGLAAVAGRRPHELSPGMAQRTALCRALLHSPRLLLMDDPFQELDPLSREQCRMDWQRLWVREPATVLFATSHIEEAVLLSDCVAVMSPNPGGRMETLAIDLPRPRRMDRATSPAIIEYGNRIRTVFHAMGMF